MRFLEAAEGRSVFRQACVIHTGARTALGHIGGALAHKPPPTAFERGTYAFGMLVARLTGLLVMFVLLMNMLMHRPFLESFLFALALAVGLTPELLPGGIRYAFARCAAHAKHVAEIGARAHVDVMVGATLILPFLPMLPVQILLNNLLYDLSELALPFDHMDEEALAKPSTWDITLVQRFMMTMGPVSSLFDFLTFFCCCTSSEPARSCFRRHGSSNRSQRRCSSSLSSARGALLFQSPAPGACHARDRSGQLSGRTAIPRFFDGRWFRPAAFVNLCTLAGIVVLYLLTMEAAKHTLRPLYTRQRVSAGIVQDDRRRSSRIASFSQLISKLWLDTSYAVHHPRCPCSA